MKQRRDRTARPAGMRRPEETPEVVRTEDLIRHEYSYYPVMLDDIAQDVIALKEKISALRKEYRRAGLLPLYSMSSDYENLNTLLRYLESEVNEFFVPVTRSRKVDMLLRSYSRFMDRE